jgi:hypothetical protein
LSDASTSAERQQPVAARLQRRPIVIMPYKCKTMDEWLLRFRGRAGR